MDGDESSMEGRTRGDGTFWSDCKDVVDCLCVLQYLCMCESECVRLRADVDDGVRGE